MPIEYDDSNLRQLFAELEPKRRTQALKGAFRREANQVRKTAINNLRSSGIKSSKDLEKGVRAVVFKRAAGFRVTIGTKRAGSNGKGEAGYHINRQGLKKPILIWAESGTEERQTKPKQGTRRRASRQRAQHSTGHMKRYGFMAQTLNDVKDTVTQNIHEMVIDNVQKVSEKYGCK
jgi:hypothetical protein